MKGAVLIGAIIVFLCSTFVSAVYCDAVQQCPGFEYSPKDAKTLVRYTCQANQCVAETKAVECTTNAACPASLPVCDTQTYFCVSGGGISQCTSGEVKCSDDQTSLISCTSGKIVLQSCDNGCTTAGAYAFCRPDGENNKVTPLIIVVVLLVLIVFLILYKHLHRRS